ncbi:MAG: NAD(P)(+) transhydrogenase (Re/Si-specific) subunit alpha, partial [Cyclobacteriaceae bacterium]
TTALLRGQKAPILITKETVEKMRPGAVIVDLAAAGGGNCALTENDKVITHNEVTIIGNSNLAAGMPMHSSQLYGKNIWNFVKTFLKEGGLSLDWDDPIIESSCVVHEGTIRYGQKQN